MTLMELWLPILLAAVFVFVASSIFHMVIPIHKTDYTQMPAEDAVLEAMRQNNMTPGTYMFPHCEDFKDLGSPEMTEKFQKGPVGHMTVLPGMPNMGKSLLQWFVFSILISAFAAHIATLSCGKGTEFGTVFHVTGIVAFVGYGATSITDSIWKGVPWGVAAKFLFDGLVYGACTGAAFGWLWPAAA